MIDSDDQNTLALEYVLGTLRGEEREAFAKQLQSDDSLIQAVRYWEESLMPAPETVPALAPKPSTFKNIQAAINNQNSSAIEEKSTNWWEKLLPWKIISSAAFAMLLVVSTLLLTTNLQQGSQDAILNTDYVAVLVDEGDAPILTALTASDGSTLWLKWEKWQTPKDHSLQLWAKSRRDGQIRPLLVFGDSELKQVALDEATLRLIQDSSHLIITQEEVGGSAVNEPSEIIIAKGVCIRLAETRDSA
jgi:anti-sigma-K factor RskA